MSNTTTGTQVELNTEEQDVIERRYRRTRPVAIVSTILLVIAIGFIVYMLFKQNNYRKQLTAERNLNNDLQKKNSELVMRNTELSSKTFNLDSSLGQAKDTINAKQVLIDRLNDENDLLRKMKDQLIKMQKVSSKMSSDNQELLRLQNEMNKLIDSTTNVNNKAIRTKY